jgi:tetraacyldisaccharide 4'-kinase
MPPIWSRRTPLARLLWPLSLIYRALFALRSGLYRVGIFKSHRVGVPVIVVGNVVAGGGGKTPTVIAVMRHLRARGLRVGLISRGYGREGEGVREVTAQSRAQEVGDEPLLVFKTFSGIAGANTAQAAPVFVAAKRIDAARALMTKHPDVQIIVSDDGLQHLALARDVEIIVFGEASLGNGYLLPAGPLREPWPRKADIVLCTGGARIAGHSAKRQLAPHALRADGSQVPLATLQGQPLTALAGIAKPESFFSMLRAAGLPLAQQIALPDHYNFDSWSRNQYAGQQLICTEKDAVKLWPVDPTALAVPLLLTPEPAFFQALEACVEKALEVRVEKP